jgi:hypothetical protein
LLDQRSQGREEGILIGEPLHYGKCHSLPLAKGRLLDPMSELGAQIRWQRTRLRELRHTEHHREPERQLDGITGVPETHNRVRLRFETVQRKS